MSAQQLSLPGLPPPEPTAASRPTPGETPGAARPETDARVLGAELERAALRELRRAWLGTNQASFRSKLRAPRIAFSDVRGRLGQWQRDSRTIEIARRLLSQHGWGTVVEVLRHEMAHQYVDEVLGVLDEPAHGPAFRAVCAERGIDARAAGLPASAASGGESRLLERVAKLLALAESPNENEAQVAAAAAQRLMLKYNLESASQAARNGYSFRHLGQPTGRVQEAERILASILEDHFFVEVIWIPVWRPFEGKRGSVLEACGTPENLELAEYVHGFLLHTAERLWAEHARQTRRRRRERRVFLAGVMSGFRDKLAAEQSSNAERGLVWVGDADLGKFFKCRHPHVRWVRHLSSERQAAHADGRAAGRNIVLHRGVHAGPGDAPPQLPPRRR